MENTEHKPTTKEKLDLLTDELNRLVNDEDLDDEKLRDASEGLLPNLCDTLAEAGYGITFYKIWSEEHRAWWKPNKAGYTESRRAAGIYPESEARAIVESANIGLHDKPNEAMVEITADEPYAL